MNWRDQLKFSLDKNFIEKNFPTFNTHQFFPIQVTPHYAQLLDTENNVSLEKIVLPSIEEQHSIGSLDVMNETIDYKVQGLQHRYPDTVLLMVSNICASHCRFCFRKRIFDFDNIENEKIENLEEIILYIESHKEINNILLSGGDPFINNNDKLLNLLKELINISHINYIRIGTKILAYLPQRITEEVEFVEKLKEFNQKKPIYIITHFDHNEEFSKETVKAIKMLDSVGLKLLSQTTLLKGINDNITTMNNLFKTFIANNIIPYYIFQTMPVKGATHFQVNLLDAIKLMNEFSANLSGLEKSYKFIIPHELGKIEAIGFDETYLYFKFHRSRDPLKIGKLFKISCKKDRVWFSENEIIYL